MIRTRIAAVLAAVTVGSSAYAADLPGGYPPPYAPGPIFTWTGLYAGINGGLGFGGFTNGGSSYFGGAVGGLVGGTLGYNYQAGPLVIGVEADVDYAGIGGGNTPRPGVSGYSNTTALGTVRGRLGYAYGRTLFYATGGYAGASFKSNLSDTASAPNVFGSSSGFMNGYTVGGGVEYALTQNVSIKGEYLFTALGSQGVFAGTRDFGYSGLNTSLVRAGINYHF